MMTDDGFEAWCSAFQVTSRGWHALAPPQDGEFMAVACPFNGRPFKCVPSVNEDVGGELFAIRF